MAAALEVGGVVPDAVVRPRDRAELAQLMRELYADRKTFAFSGGGTQLELGNPPRALATLVQTTALDRVLDYAPEDQTITVEAGMTLAQIDAVLAGHDQLLPIDVPDRAHSTIGGAIATNSFGARRHRYGSIKDLIVGIELVRADGTRARGGGKVVKNVAGFDLPKLMVGALGTLGAIVAATFRVFPRPAAGAGVVACGVDAHAFTQALLAAQLEPTSLIAVAADAQTDDVLVRFDGDPRAVAAQVERTRALAPLVDDDFERFARSEAAARAGGTWRFHASTAPSRLRTARTGAWTASAIRYPSLGVVFAAGTDCGEPVDDLAADLGTTRAEFTQLVFDALPPRWRGHIDAWGPPPPAFAVMRALKAQFDPHGLCNPGRFVGGL